MIDSGYKQFAERWNPILDVFGECGIRFALEVHPTEIAFDIYRRSGQSKRSAIARSLDSTSTRAICCGRASIRSSSSESFRPHLSLPHQGRDVDAQRPERHPRQPPQLRRPAPRLDFRSPGRGGVNFEEIIRALNQAKYEGPLSVEWEDIGMDREHGAREACEFVQSSTRGRARGILMRRLRRVIRGAEEH